MISMNGTDSQPSYCRNWMASDLKLLSVVQSKLNWVCGNEEALGLVKNPKAMAQQFCQNNW